MKLLLDANLSWRLVKKLTSTFSNILHVNQIGITTPAKDSEIWDWDLKNEFIIVSNDDDFINLLLLKGFPPKVILIRKGNLATEELATSLLECLPEINALDESKTYGLLEIF